MATEPDDKAPSRAELERIAFGRPQSPAEVAAADIALQLLVADDAARVAATHAAPEPTRAVTPSDTPAPDSVPVEHELPVRRRSPIPLVVALGLVAALILGVVLAHQPTGRQSSAAPAATATPHGDATAALQSLLSAQTRADKDYPLPGYSAEMSIQPASIHRIMTSSDGVTLWTGRSDNDLCLMWTGTDPTATIGAGISCAAPGAFNATGLRLSEGITTWTWNGKAFTASVSNASALAPW